MKNWIVIIVFLFSQVSFAECKDDIQVIDKGQSAQCSGLLFSPDASKKVSETQQDAKYYKDLSDRLFKRRDITNKEINVLDERLKLYMDQSYLLSTELHKKEQQTKWQKVIYFGLGVFATGIAVYSARGLN